MRQNVLIKIIHKLKTFLKTKKIKNLKQKNPAPPPLSYDNCNLCTISENLARNLYSIKHIFAQCSDIIIREFKIGTDQQIGVFLVMVDGLTDKAAVHDNLIKALLLSRCKINKRNALTIVEQCVLSLASIDKTKTLEKVINAILAGDTALFIDGSDTVIIASLRSWESRGVEEPDTEAVVRGPREGFVETLRNNTALLRRYIKTPNLKMEIMNIGTQTKTDVCIIYIKGIVNEKIVQEVKLRLSRIEVDSILESGYIESFIEDAPFSLFPTIGNSEKPDVISAKLLEGRVALLVDGTPFVLTIPYVFVEAFQASEDYYLRPYYATFIRLLRWLSFSIALFLPSVYVAVTTFHQEILPPDLMLSIAAAQEGTPLPAVFEAMLMQIIYEILKEAGVRLPRPVGQAISIVGAFVIGEAAVTAGLIGAPMVVIVALTAISSFVVPSLDAVNVMIRLGLLILSGFSGLYGIIMGFIVILIHQCSLRSFGIPYMSPIAPGNLSDLKDVFVRVPLWAMLTRPHFLGSKNIHRQKPSQRPTAPSVDNKN